MTESDAQKSGSLSVANEIMQYANTLAENVAKLAARMDDQLSPICRESVSIPPSAGQEVADIEREYPPYFQAMRQHFDDIQYQLSQITDVLNRCEVR